MKLVEKKQKECLESLKVIEESDFIKSLVEDEQVVNLIDRVRNDDVDIPYLIMMLRSEGLDNSVAAFERSLSMHVLE